MKIRDLDFTLYIREEQIQEAVKKIAESINRDYSGKNPLFIGILNGAYIFAADLIRGITIPSEISFIKISSYQQMHSSGNLKELVGLNEPVDNRNLIVLEDIVDTGLTLHHILKDLTDRGAGSIEVASLFLKPGSLKENLKIKYKGFEIPDEFIIGYGLDYDGYGRNLRDVYIKK